MAAWVAAEGAGALDEAAAAGAGAVGAAVAGAAVGGSGAADCANPKEGASKTARAAPRARDEVTISALLSASGRGRRRNHPRPSEPRARPHRHASPSLRRASLRR